MKSFCVVAFCLVALVGLAVAAKPQFEHNHFRKMEDHCVEKKATTKEECLKSLSSWYNSDYKNKQLTEGADRRFKTTLESFLKLSNFNLATSCNIDYRRLLKKTEGIIGWDLDDPKKNAVTRFPTVFSIWSNYNRQYQTQCPAQN